MNENLRRQLLRLESNIDSRRQSEKILVLAVVAAGIFMLWLSLASDPLKADVAAARGQVSSITRQIEAQQSAYNAMLAASQEDPNKFANDRLQVIAREQSQLDQQIDNLAGDLVTPNQMTTILTSLLERQSGLELVAFRNESPTPLSTGVNNAADILTEAGETSGPAPNQVSGQVFEHGLVIEFQGDFFSTLKYMRYLEEITGSFFWDSVEFQQLEWPNARVTLEIHTLSTDQGFIGV